MTFDDFRDTLRTGKGTNAKIIPVHLYLEEGVDQLYQLSMRQAAALLKLAQYLEWKARLYGIPEDLTDPDDFQAWNDQVKQRLMIPVEICAEIINCLATDEDTQNAFKNFIANYLSSVNSNPVGQPLPISKTTASLSSAYNPFCSLDILWSQCIYTVRTTNDIIKDALDKFETLTNPIELTAAASEVIPEIGDTVGAVPSYIALLQSFIAENYNADYTTTPVTGYEDVLACELFCACKDDCSITIDRFYTILLNRVKTRYDTDEPVITVLNDLAAYLIGIDSGGDLVADMAFLLIWGGLKLANFILGGLLNRPKVGDGVIRVWLQLAANNPDPDWSIICTTCPEYEDLFYDPNPIADGLTLDSDGEQFLGGDNRIILAPWTANIVMEAERRVHLVTVRMAFAEETGNIIIIESVEYPLERSTPIGGSTYDYVAEVPDVLCTTIDFEVIPNSETANTFVVVSMFTINVWQIE